MDDLAHFWSNVDRSAGPDACWRWTGGQRKKPRNYGRFHLRGKVYTAHRWLLGELRGKPLILKPTGVEDGCHHCDMPSCCNPAHLYVGSRKENVGDAVERSRLWMLQRVQCPRGHEYRRTGKRRYCHTCNLERDSRTARRTHCRNGHELAGSNILLCKNGTRKCRICDAARNAKRRRG